MVTFPRWLPSTTVACALHALALVGVRAFPAPIAGPPPELAETAIDVEEETPAVAQEGSTARDDDPPGEPMANAATAPRAGGPVVARAATPHDVAIGVDEQPPPNAAPEPLEPAPRTNDGWSFSPTGRTVDVAARGFGAAARDVGRDVRREAVVDSGHASTSGGVVESLDQHDANIGMGRGGPLAAALEAAARGPEGPLDGNATFDVVVGADGNVSIALSSATGDWSAWSKVGSAARGGVDTRRLHLPAGARGWHVVVRVEAKVQLVDGRDPRTLGTHVHASPGKITETKQQIVIEELPNVTLVAHGKVCGAAFSVGLGGLTVGGGCSPEVAGTGTVRIVSSRILTEGRL